MNWKNLEYVSQIEDIKEESKKQPVIIFKHSTRCSISAMVWGRLKRNWKNEDNDKMTSYYLDLITYRGISDLIAKEFGVSHQSPQVIIIKGGKARCLKWIIEPTSFQRKLLPKVLGTELYLK